MVLRVELVRTCMPLLERMPSKYTYIRREKDKVFVDIRCTKTVTKEAKRGYDDLNDEFKALARKL